MKAPSASVIARTFSGGARASGFASPPTADDFALLQNIGVFRHDCRYADGRIENGGAKALPADFPIPAAAGANCWNCARGAN